MGSCSVLVVDDDQGSGELVKRKLQDLNNCSVCLESNVEDAKSRILDEGFDVVVSDFDMGGLTGLELFESVSSVDLSFILFTGKGSERIASRAISAGVTDYIRKGGPEQLERLVNRVSKALSRRSVEKELEVQKEMLEGKNKLLEDFHKITNLDAEFDTKVEKLLGVGLDFFGLDTGILSRIEGDDYHIECIEGSDIGVSVGDVLDLENTFCQTIVKSNEPVYFNREYSDAIEEHPAYKNRQLEAYLGVPVFVDGELYGTLNFSGTERVQRDLESEGKNLVRLMAEWISKEISRLRSRQEAEGNKKRLRQVIDNIPQLVFAKDESGKFLIANEAVAEAYGTSVSELEGSTDERFADSLEEAEKFRRDDLQVIESGEVQVFPEESLTTADGEERILETTKIPYKPVDSSGEAVLGVSHDITEKKERTKSLKEKNRRLDEFNSIVSHDLRNPLNVARGFLDIARDSMKEEDLDKVENSLNRMENIIDELLAVSGDAENFEKQDLNLETVFLEAIESGNREISFELENNKDLHASRTALVNIFDNMISNSIDHNKKGVSVKVEGTSYGFLYKDDGELSEEIDEIVEHGYTSSTDGRGLGLSIIRRLANANDWSLELEKGGEGNLIHKFYF